MKQFFWYSRSALIEIVSSKVGFDIVSMGYGKSRYMNFVSPVRQILHGIVPLELLLFRLRRLFCTQQILQIGLFV